MFGRKTPSLDPKIPYRPGLPVLGHLLDLRQDRMLGLERIREEVGNLAAFDWGPVPVLLISEPDLVYRMLLEQAYEFRKGVNYKLLRVVLGAGLLTIDGENHKRDRKLLAPTFSRRALEGYVATMARVVGDYRETCVEGETIDLFQQLLELTLTVVARALFSLDPGRDLDTLLAASEVANAWTSDELTRMVHWPLSLPLARHLRLRKALAEFDGLVDRLVSARRALRPGEADPGDALSVMLAARDELTGRGLTDLEIRDEIVTLLLAGHETIASALTWTFCLLSRHPAARERVETEVREVLGDRAPSLEDVTKLRYTQQVFKEAMRLYPPVPYISRRAERPVRLGEYELAAGQAVVCFIYGIHHRSDLYPDPKRFDPDRFSPDREKQLPKGAYLPFGLGPRVCIGNHFALTEATIILASLTQRMRLELVPGQKLEGEALVSLRPKGEVRMKVALGPTACKARAMPARAIPTTR